MTRGSATCDQNFAYFTPLGANVVHCYSLTRDTWSQLPQCPYRNCGLAIVNGALVAVGGRKAYSDYSNKLLTLRVRHWFEELPPMALSRDSPSLVALEYGSGSTDILVAGGSVSDSKWTAAVEIFDARNQRWISLVDLPTPLPFPSAALRHTATSGTLLLSVIGCYRDGYTCSLYLSTESVRTSGWLSLPKLYKWKNHFYEMKGDVGMSLHEKERNKKMPTPRHKVTHNPIPTSLFCFNILFVCLFVMNALGKANSKTS